MTDETPPTALSAVSRVCLGVAVLVERQVRSALTGTSGQTGEGTAIALGLADRTATAARHLVDAVIHPVETGKAVASATPLNKLAQGLTNRVEGLAVRGRELADTVGGEAAGFLKVETDRVIAWARTTVVPPIIEDLAQNDKIRDLVFNQAYGAVTDAGQTVKGVASDADDRLEAGFQRLLRRGEPVNDD